MATCILGRQRERETRPVEETSWRSDSQAWLLPMDSSDPSALSVSALPRSIHHMHMGPSGRQATPIEPPFVCPSIAARQNKGTTTLPRASKHLKDYNHIYMQPSGRNPTITMHGSLEGITHLEQLSQSSRGTSK